MSCKATNTTCDDHWSTKSNISITSSSDGAHSPKSSSRNIFRKLSRLSKISSLASLFSTKSSNSYDSGGGGDSSGCSSSYDIKQQNNNNNNNCNHRLRKPYSSNSAIFTAASHQTNDKHRHISYTCSDFADFSGEIHAPMMHDQQQLSFAASLPVISPLLNENDHHHLHHHHHHNQQSNTTNDRNNMSNDVDQVSSFEPKNNAPQILITQPSFTEENRTKFGSLRWLRNASFRRRRRRHAGNDEAGHKQTDLNEKNPIELPPTVLFPNETYSITTGSESQTINSSSNNTSNTSSRSASPFPLADQQPRSFGQMLSHLEAVNHRRSSLYSQQSFDSIDSRLSIVDDSTLEDDYASPSRLAQSIAKNRPSPARIPMIIDDDADRDRVSRAPNSFTSMHGGGCGGTANMTKAKSDTHLYFCLDEAEPPNQSAQDDDVFENETKFFADKMEPENGSKRDDGANVPPATPLKRNSNRRSLYARFISAKRKNQPNTSTTVTQHKPTLTECTTNTNSFKQRFRFRYSSKTRPAPSDCDHDHPHLAHPHQRSLSQSKNRASEPFRINVLHHEPAARVMRREQRVPLPPISSKSEANLLSAGLQQNNNNNNNDNGFQPPLVDGVLRHTKLANECFMHENARNLSGASASPPLTADTVSNSELSTQAQYGDGSTDMKSDEQRQLDAASNGYGDRDGQISELAPTEVMGSTSRPESHASQPRESRSLIRTIRKRLSFSKRSKSVERQPNSFRERSVASVDDERARSVPGSREPSAPREMANGKKQESYLSLASNTSFFAENSTLVLECVVNGEKRHYLVPFSQANKRKYRRRKGVKLHVHNDHLFVAQHVPSSNECQVCAKSFPLRIGKQGYQCRECGFLTHKQCHALAESFCPANGAAKLNFDLDNSDTPKRVPSPLPEVRVIAPSEGSPINEKEII